VLLCSWTIFFVSKQGKRNDLETKKNERVQNLLVISLPIFRSMDFWKYTHKLASDHVSRGLISPVTPFVVGVDDRLIVEIVVYSAFHTSLNVCLNIVT